MSASTDVSVTGLLQELIRIPSVNPDLDRAGAGEAAIAGFAGEWLSRHGVEARLEFVGEGRPNVVAETGPPGGKSIALCAHLDTVSTRGMTGDPFDGRLKDGRIWGRGSYDMKGGVAAAMAAIVELACRGPAGRVVLALVVDEEYSSAGAQDFVERHPTDACVLTEPSDGDLILAHKGFVWADVTCRGRAAHGSRWDLGRSAIATMSRIVAMLEQFDGRVLRERHHELVGPASMHCGVIAGGTGISTYADSCNLKLERRTLPTESNEAAFAELRERIHSIDPEAEVTLTLERPPMTTPADCPVARAAREAIRAIRGRPARETGVAYWMDAALFSNAGIETVDFGPSGGGAHAAEEWVDQRSVIECSEVLVGTAERFLEQT